jgi:hypothetical protein
LIEYLDWLREETVVMGWLLDQASLSLRRLWRRRNAAVPLLFTIIVLAAIVATALSAVGGWVQRSRQEWRDSEMCLMKITAVNSLAPLTAADLVQLGRLPGCRAFPSLSTFPYVLAADGKPESLVCSSILPHDPGIAQAPVLEGAIGGPSPSVVLAPNLLQRLGFPTRGMAGKMLEILVVHRGPDRQELWCRFPCRIAAVLGDLGVGGMRMDLGTLVQVIRFQQGHLEAIPGARLVAEEADYYPRKPDQGPPRATVPHQAALPAPTENPEPAALLAGLGEIHLINLYVDDPGRILQLSQELEATGKYRCESKYYQYGKRAAFLRASGQIAIPFFLALLAVTAWTIFSTISEQVKKETPLICHWRSVGGRAGEIFVLYFLQGLTLSLAGSVLGTLAAVLLVAGPGQELGKLLEIDGLFGRVPACETVIMITFFGLLSALIPALRAARLDLAKGLWETGVMG